MRRVMTVWLCVLVICFMAGCGSEYEWGSESEEALEKTDMDSLVELYHIQITAGDMVLSGVLYDTPTARDFADMLPLTVELWNPAPDFARAFDLPEHIPRYAEAGYEYELGSLVYWYEGPSIALIYKESRDQTVVPVVPIGKITSDVSVFEEYGEDITIELEEEVQDAGTNTEVESKTDTGNSRILIAYFSVPEDVDISGVDAVAGASVVVKDGEKLGNTEYVAKLIQETIGGDLFRIETTEAYPLDHDPLVDQAAEEQDAGFRPTLAASVENFEQYEYVFLGFPNWWADLPMAVYSFLEEYDFGAKTIIPFITHGGSRASNTIETISQLQPGALMMGNELILSRGDVAESEETVVNWAQGLGINAKAELPDGSDGNTVLTAAAAADNSQTLYLWEEGNAPSVTEYTVNNGNYADDPDFRPYLVSFPVPEGTKVKGAVLICAGGAFQFRSDENEGTPVAEELARRGYQSFVVNYRLRPYTQEEGALDLARAVRFVRKNAEIYGIDENDIAVMGFSAGGILAGEMLLHFDGLVNGTAIDADYIPDGLDEVSADAAADGMIYSFYGRLSVSNNDVQTLRNGELPPTFYCYGTRDPFYDQFLANAAAAEEAGVRVERLQLDGRPHGFGYREGWFDAYDHFLTDVFSSQ